jgi:hypothetical protein
MKSYELPGIFLGCKGRPARKADNFTAICESFVQKMWEPRRLANLCYRDSFTFSLEPLLNHACLSVSYIKKYVLSILFHFT